jgi:hypothetical protein
MSFGICSRELQNSILSIEATVIQELHFVENGGIIYGINFLIMVSM